MLGMTDMKGCKLKRGSIVFINFCTEEENRAQARKIKRKKRSQIVAIQKYEGKFGILRGALIRKECKIFGPQLARNGALSSREQRTVPMG